MSSLFSSDNSAVGCSAQTPHSSSFNGAEIISCEGNKTVEGGSGEGRTVDRGVVVVRQPKFQQSRGQAHTQDLEAKIKVEIETRVETNRAVLIENLLTKKKKILTNSLSD